MKVWSIMSRAYTKFLIFLSLLVLPVCVYVPAREEPSYVEGTNKVMANATFSISSILPREMAISRWSESSWRTESSKEVGSGWVSLLFIKTNIAWANLQVVGSNTARGPPSSLALFIFTSFIDSKAGRVPS